MEAERGGSPPAGICPDSGRCRQQCCHWGLYRRPCTPHTAPSPGRLPAPEGALAESVKFTQPRIWAPPTTEGGAEAVGGGQGEVCGRGDGGPRAEESGHIQLVGSPTQLSSHCTEVTATSRQSSTLAVSDPGRGWGHQGAKMETKGVFTLVGGRPISRRAPPLQCRGGQAWC